MTLPETAFAQFTPLVVERVPALVDDIREGLRPGWPDHAAFLAENRDEVIEAASAVVRRLVVGVDEPGPDASATPSEGPGERELFEHIGRLQWREGKDLAELLSAYRTAVRVFWHHVSAIALETGVGTDSVAALAETVFFFVDRLSSSSARGYVREQSEAGAERERHRDELVTLLLSDRADAGAVRAAALRAGWTVPDEVAVVLVPPDDTAGVEALARFGPSALPVRRGAVTGAVVPHPSRQGSPVVRALRGTRAVIGAAVAPERLPASLHIAEIAARLHRDHLLAGDPVFATDHLDAIIVHRDARLLEALRAQVLAPLRTATPASSRERLAETLRSWLRHMGDRQAMAAELHVHPQTVRYRLGRLQDLFGDALDDPAQRARLTLALSWPG